MKENSLMTPPRKYIFLSMNQINFPINKKYRILPYTTKIIKNENNVFDLIHYLGNKKKYFQLKEIYEEAKNNIKKRMLLDKKKEKKYIISNKINIKTFDFDKINVHSPISIMEGNFISGLIDYCKYKKKKEEKILKLKQKNKFVFKKPKLNQDSVVKANKNKRKTISYLCIGNKNTEEEKKTNNEILNDSKTSNLDNQFKFCSINSIEDVPMSLENRNELRKIKKSILLKNYNKLNKDKKSLSADNFFGIQSKKIKLDGNYKEQNLNLKHKKITKLFFSKIFKEENNIENNLKDINNDLIDIKFTNFIDNTNILFNDNNLISNSKTLNNFHTPRKNKFKYLKENLTTFKKSIYEFPEVNKYIYGTRNPLKLFSKLKTKPKIDNNISE